ncbi:hypothetical protein PanWU01x14_030240, partial [Parasponia andersonii]
SRLHGKNDILKHNDQEFENDPDYPNDWQMTSNALDNTVALSSHSTGDRDSIT